MSILRKENNLVCDDCGSDRAGYACAYCQDLVCSCSVHDCPVLTEQMEQERHEWEQEEFERRQYEERREFYGW